MKDHHLFHASLIAMMIAVAILGGFGISSSYRMRELREENARLTEFIREFVDTGKNTKPSPVIAAAPITVPVYVATYQPVVYQPVVVPYVHSYPVVQPVFGRGRGVFGFRSRFIAAPVPSYYPNSSLYYEVLSDRLDEEVVK